MGIIIFIALLTGVFGSLIAIILTCIYVSHGQNGFQKTDWYIYGLTLVALTLILGSASWAKALMLDGNSGEPSGEVWTSLIIVAFILGASPGVGAILGSIIVFFKRRNRK